MLLPEGLQTSSRCFDLGEAAAFLLDEVILDSPNAFRGLENLLPIGCAFSK
jgi:hypothetical protein